MPNMKPELQLMCLVWVLVEAMVRVPYGWLALLRLYGWFRLP
jgi:hypothetical protein